jgi:DNA polymerase III epsilon subunit-like protein
VNRRNRSCARGVLVQAEYDREVLHVELARENLSLNDPPPALRHNIEWIDPLVWARETQKNGKSRALSEVAERLGVALERAHRAANDAEATLHVLSHIMREPRVPKTYGTFVQEQRRLARLFDDERKVWRASPGATAWRVSERSAQNTVTSDTRMACQRRESAGRWYRGRSGRRLSTGSRGDCSGLAVAVQLRQAGSSLP